MSILTLNIGQLVGAAHIHTLETDLAAVAIAFPEFSVVRSFTRIAESGEPTSCIQLKGDCDLTGKLEARLFFLCTLTSQEAIPARCDDVELLAGPNAAAWGDFNPDLFLEALPDNRPVPARDALWTLRSGRQYRDGWTLGTHDETLSGWFERDADGTGGNLLYERNEADQLELIDYDGVFALPVAILTLLRDIGVQADRSFE